MYNFRLLRDVKVNISAITWLSTITITHLAQTGTLPTSSHTYQQNPANYRSNYE